MRKRKANNVEKIYEAETVDVNFESENDDDHSQNYKRIFSDTSNGESDEGAESQHAVEHISPGRQKWTKHCKLLLLRALKKHGHDNIQRIWEELPNKSLRSITAMINKIKARSRRMYKSSKSPLNAWIANYLFPKENSMVSQALLFIHLFEEHPENSVYNYSAIYNLLYKLSLGHSPDDLPQESQNMLYNLLHKIIKTECENRTSLAEIFLSLGKIYRTKKYARTYSGKKKHSSSQQPSMVVIDVDDDSD